MQSSPHIEVVYSTQSSSIPMHRPQREDRARWEENHRRIDSGKDGLDEVGVEEELQLMKDEAEDEGLVEVEM